MATKYWAFVAAIAVFLALSAAYFGNARRPYKTSIKVWSHQGPTSSDPIEFDLAANHFVFGPVFSKLFTTYKSASISNSLAKSWSVENSGTEWRIVLRDDVRFSNGDLIHPSDVVLSIKRVLLNAKRNGSMLPLLKQIKGASALIDMKSKVEGLQFDEREVIISLHSPNFSLNEDLSFGLFGVVHKSNYQNDTGAWIDGPVIASGPYSVSYEFGGATLRLRADFPKDLRHPNAPDEILAVSEPSLRSVSDLVDGYLEDAPGGADKFFGNTSSDILYMQVFNRKKGILSTAAGRRRLREDFYQELEATGNRATRSFFPLIFSGVSEISAKNEEYDNGDSAAEIFYKPPTNKRIIRFLEVTHAMSRALKKNGAKFNRVDGIGLEVLNRIVRGEQVKGIRLDIGTRITSMGGEDPRNTFRFMLSREGIFLPDPGLELYRLVQKDNFSLQVANEIIFKEAMIWPIFHFSMGFWAKSDLDLTMYNKQWPLSELQWIGKN